jgi:GT2 family glycosyltransferase
MAKNTKSKPHNPLEGGAADLTLDLHDGTDEQISIIIVHKDRPAYLNICLQSISVCSNNNNYEIVVVDNASGKESQDFLDDIADEVTLVRNEKNLYWSGGANRGVEAASKNSKYLLFLHCDTVVLNPGWLDLLVSVAQARNSGIVGIDQAAYYLQGQKIDFIPEWCMLMTRECWKAVGPFPDALPMIGHSFIMSFKAQRMGYSPQVMKNPIVHHYHIFSLEDVSVWEKMLEGASANIPNLLRSIQSEGLNI